MQVSRDPAHNLFSPAMSTKMSAHPTRIAVAERTTALAYYHAHKELMNVQSFLSKLNKSDRAPRYVHRVAYGLHQDACGKWHMSDAVKALMIARDLARVAAEEATQAPAAPAAQEAQN